MRNSKTVEKLNKYLFEDGKLTLTDKETEIFKRARAIFTIQLSNPYKTDKQLSRIIMKLFDVKKTTAYDDIARVKLLLGNVKNASKEWHRYALIEMVKETYDIAKKKGDPMAMAAIVDKLGKYTQLDKEESEKIPYDEIIPDQIEYTTDVTVLGKEPIKDLEEKKNKLREKYTKELPAQDIDYEELLNEKDLSK